LTCLDEKHSRPKVRRGFLGRAKELFDSAKRNAPMFLKNEKCTAQLCSCKRRSVRSCKRRSVRTYVLAKGEVYGPTMFLQKEKCTHLCSCKRRSVCSCTRRSVRTYVIAKGEVYRSNVNVFLGPMPKCFNLVFPETVLLLFCTVIRTLWHHSSLAACTCLQSF